MATRRSTARPEGGAAAPATRRTRPAPRRRPAPAPRIVEDDTEVLAAEHAARDAELLDLVARISA